VIANSAADSPRARWGALATRLLTFIVIVLGARTMYLCATYLSGSQAPKRFQVETTATWFVVAVVVSAVVRRAARVERIDVRVPRNQVGEWGVWCLAAVALYWPALGVGFLSDDFVLAHRASQLALGFVHPELFRPLPLVIWAVILRLGGGPPAIHLLNVLLHGTNAFLTTRIVEPIVRSRSAARLAGFVLLTMPILTEPVVWCSGVFDVMATTFVLLAVLAAREYQGGGRTARLRLFACAAAALLSKETAVVTPVLIILDAWVRHVRARRLYADVTVLLVAMAVAGAARFAFATSLVRRPLSRYLVQRWLFGTFGGLAVPWHAEIIASHPWVPIASACIVVIIVLAFGITSTDTVSLRCSYAMTAWIGIATVPTLTFFVVAPDLQGSRYLYLASIGWSALLVSLVANQTAQSLRACLSLCLVVLAVVGVYGVRRHIQPWRAAAAIRGAVETAALGNPQIVACHTVAIRNAPDSARGAYVLRNGLPEAFARDVGVAVIDTAPAMCSFQWNAGAGRFEPR
jgi:hypothetical protein